MSAPPAHRARTASNAPVSMDRELDRELDRERAWMAVARRDPSLAGRLIYAVRTTGVYCRPGCASRLPLRENTVFFDSAADARAAGFRACKRCRPDEDHGTGLPPSSAELGVERARAYLDAHLGERVTLARLAGVAHLSPYHLQRTFREQIGVTPRQYVDARRMERVRERLRDGDTVSRATLEAGYGSANAVYEHASERLGMTPGRYRRGGDGMQIRYALRSTPLGWVLLAATERGVCTVALGDGVESLHDALREEYPRAELAPAGAELDPWMDRIAEYLDGDGGTPEVPLDLHATDFQMRVWRALREIPYGATRSYRQLAASIGAEGSARAVARACASNPVALVVPCHRVVRSDGETSGYRWGVERKQRLLGMERERR